MGILDDAMRWGRGVGAAATGNVKGAAKSLLPTSSAYEKLSRSKLGRAAGAVGAGIHGASAAGAFNSGDPYKLSGHGLMAGLDAFAPTRPVALAADSLSGGSTADMLSAGMRRADEFMANTFGNERAKTRLAMAGPRQAEPSGTAAQPAVLATPAAPAQGQAEPVERPASVGGEQAPQQPNNAAEPAPASLGGARRELPEAPKIDFSAPEGDRTGFGLAMKLMSQMPKATQYNRDAKNAQFQFAQDKHADDVRLKEQQLAAEQAKTNAAIEHDKNAKLAQQSQRSQELDDKRMKQFMEDTNVHTISQEDAKTGKISQIADDAKNNDFRNFIRQYGGSEAFDQLTAMPAAQRQKAIAEYKQMYNLRDKVNSYAAERGGVTTSGPVGLGRARDYSFSRDVLNPGGVGLWTYMKGGGFLDRADNPRVVDTTIAGPNGKRMVGQSIPVSELISGDNGTIDADSLNLLRQNTLSGALR